MENLRPSPGSRSARKRVGRGHGSGHGKTSGRGHKGQKSRTGPGVPAWFEGGQMPLYRRVPKRGFKSIHRVEYQVVNLLHLERLEESAIDPVVLKSHGLIGNLRRPVKVLGRGSIERAIDLRVHAISASAQAKIRASGGSVELIA